MDYFVSTHLKINVFGRETMDQLRSSSVSYLTMSRNLMVKRDMQVSDFVLYIIHIVFMVPENLSYIMSAFSLTSHTTIHIQGT